MPPRVRKKHADAVKRARKRMIRTLDKAIADGSGQAPGVGKRVAAGAEKANGIAAVRAATKAARGDIDRAMRRIERAAEEAAAIGVSVGLAMAGDLEGDAVAPKDPYGPRRAGKPYADGVPLSRRASATLRAAVAAGATAGIRFRAAAKAVRAVRTGDPATYAERVRAASVGGGPAVRAEVAAHLRRMEELAEAGRGTSAELARFRREVERVAREEARAVTAEATAARWAARTKALAMAEVAGAFSDGMVATLAGSKRLLGWRWSLSPSHKFKDICDEYADGSSPGMPRGVYLEGELPPLPPHPGCLCWVTPVEES